MSDVLGVMSCVLTVPRMLGLATSHTSKKTDLTKGDRSAATNLAYSPSPLELTNMHPELSLL